jgi:hypothetical protein
MLHRASQKHESIFDGSKKEDSRVGEAGRFQKRDCPTLWGRPGHAQALLQAVRRTCYPLEPGTRLPARLRSWTRRPGSSFWGTSGRGRGPPTLRGGTVPARRGGGESERSDGMPGDKTPLSQSKKKIRRGSRKRRVLKAPLESTQIGCIDPQRLVFVDEMGTHTSLLSPLYAYAPVGENELSSRSRGTAGRTPPCFRAFAS